MRDIERHGSAEVLERAYTGFTALPAPAAPRAWRDVLGFGAEANPERYFIERAYRKLASERHPDKGGSDADMAELNRARDEALKEIA